MCAEARPSVAVAANCVAGRCQADAGLPQVDSSLLGYVLGRNGRRRVHSRGRRCVSAKRITGKLASLGGRIASTRISCFDFRGSAHRIRRMSSKPTCVLHRKPESDVASDPAPLITTARAGSSPTGRVDRRLTASTLPPFFEPAHSGGHARGSSADLVRVDVREIVKKWRRRDPRDRRRSSSKSTATPGARNGV